MIPPGLAAITPEEWREILRADPALRDRVADAARDLYYEELDARPTEPMPDLGEVVHDEGEEPDLV